MLNFTAMVKGTFRPNTASLTLACLAVTTLAVRAPMRIVTNDGTLGFTNDAFGLRVADIAQPPMFLVIETSSNLVDWFGIYTNRSPGTSQTFADFDASTYPFRFYRGVGRDPLFQYGLAAKGAISLNGNNVRFDSFDSSDPNASTDGAYDPAKARDHGDVATNLTLTNSVSVGNADIYGKVSTGPGGTVAVGSNGGIGSMAWHMTGHYGVEPGFLTNDMAAIYPDVTVPFASNGYLTAPSATNLLINGVAYSELYNSGTFKLTNFYLSGQSRALIDGDVSIWLTGGLSMIGQGQVDLAIGARLSLYLGAPSSIGGNGFRNSGDASRCIVYGLPGCTSLSVSGVKEHTGCIYAPNASLSMSSGGTNTCDFAGATITKTAVLAGYFNFHFDENLQREGPSR